jgi:[acyl-carrier-protein] S-malonyltransferase
MTQTFAAAFPGQGSQSLGMLSDLAAAHPQVLETFEEASSAISLDLWKLTQDGPESDLNLTENTQPAMLAAGVAVWRLWQNQGGPMPAVSAGHSLGEYTALTAAGVIPFTAAVQLVRERGRLMQLAVPQGAGAMAAILGLADDQIEELCADAAQSEVCEAVNFNAPGQVVVAGDKPAVDRLLLLAKEAKAKRAIPLSVSVPSHCSLMYSAAEALRPKLDAIPFGEAKFPVVHNVSAKVSDTAEAIREALGEQLYRPVRWVASVQEMHKVGAATLVEFGPGKVLTGLVKRIEKSFKGLAVMDAASLDKALEEINHVES